MRNRNIDLIKERYHLKVIDSGKEDWFIVTKINDSSNDNEDYKLIEAKLLPFELGDKLIGGYQEDSKHARQVLEDILGLTVSWSIGYIDADFELSYRSWEFVDETLLSAIYLVMERYNAIVEWDTTNRTINMIKPELHGINRLGTFSWDRFLDSVNKETNAEIVVTRLRPIGKDGLGIERLTPNGTPFLEDFSYWMYPFERDSTKNIISHSYYMSDSLCNALLDYQEKTESYDGQFNSLTSQIDNLETELSQKRNELASLKIELSEINQLQAAQQTDGVMFFDLSTFTGGTKNTGFPLKNLYNYAVFVKVGNATGKSVSVNGVNAAIESGKWVLASKFPTGTGNVTVSIVGTGSTEVFIQIANITQVEYNTSNNGSVLINKYNFDHKNMQIKDKELQIQQLSQQVTGLRNQISAINNDLSIHNNFTSEQLSELDNFIFEQKFIDDTLIEDTDLLEEAKKRFKEFQIPQLSITIDIIDFMSCIEEQSVWGKLYLGDKIRIRHNIFPMLIEAKIIGITYDYDNNKIDLTIANFKDLKTEQEMLEKYIYDSKKTTTIVSDGTSKWNQAIVDNSEFSQIFEHFWDKTTNQINMAVNQTVHIGDNGITIVDHNDPLRFLRLTNGVIGLTRSGGLRYETAISADGIIAEMVLGKLILGQRVTIGDADGIWMTEGPKTTITDRCGRIAMKLGLYETNPDLYGMVINRYDETTPCSTNLLNKIIANSEDGFKIQQWNGVEFKDKFYVDVNGLLFAEDMTAKRLKIVSGSDELILDSYTKYMNIGKFDEIIVDGKLTALEKLQVLGERTRIISEYAKLLAQANIYKETSRDSSIRINTTNFTNSYNNLMNYLSPLLANMEETTEIDRNEFIAKFKSYYDEVTNIINAINDSIKYSSVQFGSYFNDVIIDYANGIIATRSDRKYRSWMSGTRGFVIQRNTTNPPATENWVDVFWADLNGIVHAQGIRVKDSFITDGGIEGSYIILRDGIGGVMKLYPSDGLWAGSENYDTAPFWVSPQGKLKLAGNGGSVFIDTEAGVMNLNNINVIGAGRIEADSIIVNTAIAGIGIISDLTVRRLVTLPQNDTVGFIANYIHVEDTMFMLKTGEITGRTQLESNGSLLYWTDSSKTLVTTDRTTYPVWNLNINDANKMIISFDENDPNLPPYIRMGVGDGVIGDSGRGFIRKPVGHFSFDYHQANTAKVRRLRLQNDGILIHSEDGSIKIEHNTGTYFEVSSNGNEIKMFHKTAGSVSINNSGLTANITGNISLTASGQVNVSGTSYNFS